MNAKRLILGSTSPFRRQLLRKLGLDFSVHAPQIEEHRHPGESAESLVLRLAEAKARASGQGHPGALVIGSDQVACLDDEILGKPGNRENAIAQLLRMSGREITFLTGLCLLNTLTGRAQVVCEPFRVHFRKLNKAQIGRYVDAEQPFQCAGSFKSEGLGITLFERLQGDDPNTLVGLPLIRLVALLENEDVCLP